MASLLTFTFTLPLYAPKSSFQGVSSQELRWSKAVMVRISSRFPGKREQSLPGAGTCTFSRSSSVQQSICRSSTAHSEKSGDLFSCSSLCTRFVTTWLALLYCCRSMNQRLQTVRTFRAGVNFNAAIPWSESMEAAFTEISHIES